MRRPGHLVAAGRDCDIFECGAGLVLRRSRLADWLAAEAAVMDFVRAQDYPVPAVEDISDDGTDLVLERIDSLYHGAIHGTPPMDHPPAGLGTRSATPPPPARQVLGPQLRAASTCGSGDQLVHLDLHPLNVIIGPAGPGGHRLDQCRQRRPRRRRRPGLAARGRG